VLQLAYGDVTAVVRRHITLSVSTHNPASIPLDIQDPLAYGYPALPSSDIPIPTLIQIYLHGSNYGCMHPLASDYLLASGTPLAYGYPALPPSDMPNRYRYRYTCMAVTTAAYVSGALFFCSLHILLQHGVTRFTLPSALF
jgi:hypothetical protein